MEFEVLDTFVAGMILDGGEVKMLRGGHGSLQGSHVRIANNEAWLLNAQIPPYPFARYEDDSYDPTHSRKLLFKKTELLKLEQLQHTKGYALICTKIGLIGRYIKAEIAVARGKSQRDRREEIRRRDIDRAAAKEISG